MMAMLLMTQMYILLRTQCMHPASAAICIPTGTLVLLKLARQPGTWMFRLATQVLDNLATWTLPQTKPQTQLHMQKVGTWMFQQEMIAALDTWTFPPPKRPSTLTMPKIQMERKSKDSYQKKNQR